MTPQNGGADSCAEPVWDFNSDTFSLPENSGQGRMQLFRFSDTLHFYRSEFRVSETCEIETVADEQLPAFLSSTMLISGQAAIITPDSARFPLDGRSATLLRLGRPGSRIVLPGNQVIKHVGVATTVDAMRQRLDAALPGGLQRFDTYLGDGVLSALVPVRARLRKLMSQAFVSRIDSPVQRIRLEGLALSILAELLECAAGVEDEPVLKATSWESDMVDELPAFIDANLERALSTEMLADRLGISRQKLYALCRNRFQCSPRELIVGARMKRAWLLINHDGASVKQVAQQVGYSHVSNFTSAYRDFHGETPARTRRK